MNRRAVLFIIFGIFILVALYLKSNPATEFQIPKPKQTQSKAQKEPPLLGVQVTSLVTIEGHAFLEGQKALKIECVVLDTVASKAGLKAGDLIVQYDDHTFVDAKPDEASADFRDYIREEKKVGENFYLKIFRMQTTLSAFEKGAVTESVPFSGAIVSQLVDRQKLGEKLALQITKGGTVFELNVELGHRPHYRTEAPIKNSELFPDYDAVRDEASELIYKLLGEFELKRDFADLIERYDADEWWDDGLRLGHFRFVHRDPLKLPYVSEQIIKHIEDTSIDMERGSTTLLSPLAYFIDENKILKMNRIPRGPQSQSVRKHFKFIEQILLTARDFREVAFKDLTPEDIQFLYDQKVNIGGRYINRSWVSGDSQADFENFQRILKLTRQIHYAELIKSAQTLWQLTDPVWLKKLHNTLLRYKPKADELKTEGLALGDVKMVYTTKAGPIVVGGVGKTVYQGDLAFVIDLGGDDFYRNNAGSARQSEMPLAFVIDFSGNDSYNDTRPVSQGAAFLGVGFLLDLTGDDTYIAMEMSQGSGFMGIGLLQDKAGNDQYNAQEFSQAVGFWGIGVLLDQVGDDNYRAHYFVQGLGGPKSVGLLWDQAGNDSYYATGKYKSSYGVKGVFSGMSQGFGFGLRGHASGGLGILLDGAGADLFEAGNFSQGGGYYFGYGILKNSGHNNDEYRGSRYAQGFSAHSAAGILIDDGGDDTYIGRVAAMQGAAWDLGSAALIDKAGNDVYDGLGLSYAQGAAAHNGVALFIDYAGLDTYLLKPNQQGRVSDNSYHKGTSLAVFMDIGGEKDEYPLNTKLNDQIEHFDEHGLFIDLEGTLKEVLSDSQFLKLIKKE